MRTILVIVVVLVCFTAYTHARCTSNSHPECECSTLPGPRGPVGYAVNGAQGLQGPPGVLSYPETSKPSESSFFSTIGEWMVWLIKLPFALVYEGLVRGVMMVVNQFLNAIVLLILTAGLAKLFQPLKQVSAPTQTFPTTGGFTL